MDLHALWFLVAAILVIVGLVGTVLPALPGVPLVFCGLLLAAWADGFAHAGALTLFVLGVLTVIALAIDFIAGVLGAKKVGASRYAVIGAALGTLLGLFFGLPGLLLGPFVGALVGELVAGGTLRMPVGGEINLRPSRKNPASRSESKLTITYSGFEEVPRR